jgi:hypothetical protein
MSDSQLITVAFATVPTMIAVLIGILINNVRLNDFRAEFNRGLRDTRDVLRAEMAKNHSEMLLKFAELDHRLTRLEAALGER